MNWSYLPFDAWRKAVGPRVAAVTCPAIVVRDGVLVVGVTTEWFGDVIPMTQRILENLHAEGFADIEVLEWHQELAA